MEPVRVHLAVLSIAEPSTSTNVAMESIVADRATEAGHQIAGFTAVRDSEAAIRAQLVGWIADPDIDVVLVIGESEATSRALAPLVAQALPGFADLLRMLAFQEIGASAMLSTAEAARCDSTFVFVLPANENAVRAAMDKLILPQLDPRTKPRNLIASMPRLAGNEVTRVDVAKGDITKVDIPTGEVTKVDNVPSEIPAEKTAAGAGLPPRLPAASAPVLQRSRSHTGKNVLGRNVEDPTKPIELVKLEEQIELSKTSGDRTRQVDLSATAEAAKPAAAMKPSVASVVKPVGVVKPIGVAKPSKAFEPAPVGVAKPIETRPSSASKPSSISSRPFDSRPIGVAKPSSVIKPITASKPIELTKPKPIELTKPRPIESKPFESKPFVPSSGIAPIGVAKPVEPPTPAVPSVAQDPGRLPARPPGADQELLELDEDDLVAEPAERPEPVFVAPAPVVVAPTPSPQPVEVARPALQASAPEPVVPPALYASEPAPSPAIELPSPPLASSSISDLPGGAFDYAPQLRPSKAPIVIGLVAVAAAIGVGAFVFLDGGDAKPRPVEVAQTTERDASTEPTPDAPPEQASKVTEPADAQVAEPEPAVTAPVAKPRTSRRSQSSRGSTDSSTSTPRVREPVAEKPATTAPSSDCEEVECVVEKYARPCCARYKPAGDGFQPDDPGDSLDRAQIRAGVDRMKAKVIACGEQFTAKGTVKLAITVDGEGNVQELSVQTTPDDALGSCVADVLRKARFAKTANGGSFNYPFVF